jgi:GT2 family glycosyltransferase/glycosyltransferase involved in cell wall biosynthesis
MDAVTRNPLPDRVRQSQAVGWLVLGMHRSGTSALSRVLGLCGADIGHRLVEGSEGNEGGHWEDAVAVEHHERLLADFGVRWDEPFALSDGWQETPVARSAIDALARYIRDDRDQHELWAVKDPRLSVLAPLWKAAASRPLPVVLSIRHPLEVAQSLVVRDGMGLGRALALWLEHTISAATFAADQDHVVVAYADLIDDWRAVIDRIQHLQGGERLSLDQATAVDRFIDRGRRHQRAADDSGLPSIVLDVWHGLDDARLRGRLDANQVAAWSQQLKSVVSLVQPMYGEWRVRERALWDRVARAEHALAGEAVALRDVPTDVAELRSRIDEQHRDIVAVLSHDLVRMQEQVSDAERRAASAESGSAQARELVPMLGQLSALVEATRDSLVDTLSDDVRRQQSVVADALASAASKDAEAALARGIVPEVARLSDVVQAAREDIVRAISEDLVRQQAEVAAAHRAAAALEAAVSMHQQSAAAALDEASALQQRIDALAVDVHREAEARREAERRVALAELDARRLGALAEELALIKGSRSWRWMRPLRALARLLGGRWSARDSEQLGRLYRRLLLSIPLLPATVRDRAVTGSLPAEPKAPDCLPDASVATSLYLGAPDLSMPDVFVWSVIDWHFRTQRPQHLARALASKGHRVFYVSNNFIDSETPGFHVEPLSTDGRLFQVHLNLKGRPAIYHTMPEPSQVQALSDSIAALLSWTGTQSSISLVQHPFWTPFSRIVPSARLVYDCMDHHAGFGNNADPILAAEAALVTDSDLVVVTSEWLRVELEGKARALAVVRNACDYAFFREPPKTRFSPPRGRRVIGYFGAIAEWFDLDLIRAIAKAHPDDLVVLVGNDTVGAGAALADLPNVELPGEVRYNELPHWLYGFDVCLLPFKVSPLTLATNPVKVYEYLAAGKPVVAIDLPEMVQFEGLVRTAGDAASFVSEVSAALQAPGDAVEIKARQDFASRQTWAARAAEFDQAMAEVDEPVVSVVVLTYNNLAFTEACLFSIEAYSDYRNLEVIVVDNASTDGSADWLRNWASTPSDAGHRRRLVLNASNLGFSAGNNVGLREATGDYLVLLNNDTYVTPGWVRGLCAHLRRDPRLGLVGPVTNNIGNEARIEIAYSDMTAMIAEAGRRTRRRPGARLNLPTVAFFCVAMARSTFERVGELDEAFGIGFFEDDDYCRRVALADLSVACAEDVFVHHHLSASFDALKAERKRELFETNKAIYEAKWGPWEPHKYRA